MDTFVTRHLCSPAMGEDVFGAEFAAREIVYDNQNKDLFLKMMYNYKNWQVKNHRFHGEF